MLVTRSNPRGGRPLEQGSFPLHEDNEGNLGFLIGYVPIGARPGDKLLLRMSEAEEVAMAFWSNLKNARSRLGLKEKIPLKHKLIKLLGGTVDNQSY